MQLYNYTIILLENLPIVKPLTFLPPINATINGITELLLVFAVYFIKKGKTNLNGVLSVKDKAYLSDLNVRNNLRVGGNVNIKKSLSISGNINAALERPSTAPAQRTDNSLKLNIAPVLALNNKQQNFF